MRSFEVLRARYLRDSWPIQLGGIASNLARLARLPQSLSQTERVENLLLESEYFIEWSVPLVPKDSREKLVELQLQLALWRRAQPLPWHDPLNREEVRRKAKEWSDRVLEMSGLLGQALKEEAGHRA